MGLSVRVQYGAKSIRTWYVHYNQFTPLENTFAISNSRLVREAAEVESGFRPTPLMPNNRLTALMRNRGRKASQYCTSRDYAIFHEQVRISTR
jgi:hypothetical protein